MSAQWIYGDTEPVPFTLGADLTGATVVFELHGGSIGGAPIASTPATVTNQTGGAVTVDLSTLGIPAPTEVAVYVGVFVLTRNALTQTTDTIVIEVEPHTT